LFFTSTTGRRALLWRYWVTALAVYFIQREMGEPTRNWAVPALVAVAACIHRNRGMGDLAAVAYTARTCFL
jgi:hypothetical protein